MDMQRKNSMTIGKPLTELPDTEALPKNQDNATSRFQSNTMPGPKMSGGADTARFETADVGSKGTVKARNTDPVFPKKGK